MRAHFSRPSTMNSPRRRQPELLEACAVQVLSGSASGLSERTLSCSSERFRASEVNRPRYERSGLRT
jgi:hypothetical protein